MSTQEEPRSNLADILHLDPRLQESNFKMLENLNSREQVTLKPVGKLSGYTPENDNEIEIKLQNHSALLDPTSVYVDFDIENKDATNYIFSDGLNTILDDVQVTQGNVIIEHVTQGSRLSQHLILATSTQSHYDYELNALQKSYAFRSFNRRYAPHAVNNDYNIKGVADGANLFIDQDENTQIGGGGANTLHAMCHLHHLSFFRSREFKPLFLEYEFRFKLPKASHIMQRRTDGAGNAPDYEIKNFTLKADLLYPSQDVLDELFNKMNNSDEGLTYILDDTVEVFTKPLVDDVQNDIQLLASFSDVQGLVAFVIPKQDAVTTNNVDRAPLPALEGYTLEMSNQDIAVRGGVSGGLENAYAHYRKLYNTLGDIGGIGMLDFERFKNHHTAMCLSTEILRDAPASTMKNALETFSRSGQLSFTLKTSSVAGNNSLANRQLLIYLYVKKVVNIVGSVVSVGR